MLLIEMLCVMDVAADQLAFKCFTLGLAVAAMVVLVHSGEFQDEQSQRFIWRALAMFHSPTLCSGSPLA